MSNHDRAGKLLYLMHVDWNWIIQRPHFLAEQLSQVMHVDVAYPLAYRRRNLTRNTKSKVHCRRLFRLPGCLTKYTALAALDRWLLEWQLARRLSGEGYDFLWLCSPDFFPAVRRHLGKTRLIYDCMDDHPEIARSRRDREHMLRCEQELLRRADVVLVSSQALARIVKERGYPREPVLVNNGISDRLLTVQVPPRRPAQRPFRLLYFGTIGSWFDFPAIEALLEHDGDVTLRIAGPSLAPIPSHPRIEYVGVVPHDSLGALVADSDALIMPFVVNDLIRAVDPVKVYEYIAFRRNVIVPEYPEMRRFGDFVARYSGAEGLIEAVTSLRRDNTLRYTDEAASAFLREQTWSRRAERVLSALEA